MKKIIIISLYIAIFGIFAGCAQYQLDLKPDKVNHKAIIKFGNNCQYVVNNLTHNTKNVKTLMSPTITKISQNFISDDICHNINFRTSKIDGGYYFLTSASDDVFSSYHGCTTIASISGVNYILCKDAKVITYSSSKDIGYDEKKFLAVRNTQCFYNILNTLQKCSSKKNTIASNKEPIILYNKDAKTLRIGDTIYYSNFSTSNKIKKTNNTGMRKQTFYVVNYNKSDTCGSFYYDVLTADNGNYIKLSMRDRIINDYDNNCKIEKNNNKISFLECKRKTMVTTTEVKSGKIISISKKYFSKSNEKDYAITRSILDKNGKYITEIAIWPSEKCYEKIKKKL